MGGSLSPPIGCVLLSPPPCDSDCMWIAAKSLGMAKVVLRVLCSLCVQCSAVDVRARGYNVSTNGCSDALWFKRRLKCLRLGVCSKNLKIVF